MPSKRTVTVNGAPIHQGSKKAHNPLTDPKPGDVVLLRDGSRAEVDFKRNGYVGVWLREKRTVRVTLAQWVIDCEGAEVLHVAE